MNPIMVKKELPGYLADRLQEALWRELYISLMKDMQQQRI